MKGRQSSTALLVLCLIVTISQPLQAIVNEALHAALEAAKPYVKKGFSVRADNWQGKMNAGKKKVIKHQLYKGNEYWFWLGSHTPGVKLSVKVYDSKGRPVDVETKSGKNSASARVLAPKTGTYYIAIRALPAKAKEKREKKTPRNKVVEWALVYGFR